MSVNSGDPDKQPRSVASDLGLHCLSMSQKKGARQIKVQAMAVNLNTAQLRYHQRK